MHRDYLDRSSPGHDVHSGHDGYALVSQAYERSSSIRAGWTGVGATEPDYLTLTDAYLGISSPGPQSSLIHSAVDTTSGAGQTTVTAGRDQPIRPIPAQTSEVLTPGTTRGSTAPRTDWTVVVDLTTTIRTPDGSVTLGAESIDKKLRDLQAESVGRSVSIVVQVAHPDPAPGSTSPQIERYIIRDGQIQSLGTSQSQGMERNLTDLLKVATTQAPSQRLALIEQSHGGANGVRGDTGNITMDHLAGAIRDGLAGSGHQSLDVLDFDSCEMASTNTLSRLGGVAQHVVASEAPETGFVKPNGVDGQNLVPVLDQLLQHSTWNGNQLAEEFVRSARAGNNGMDAGTGHSGTDTLAHFDMSQYQQFQTSLDRLGQALEQAIQAQGTPARKAIEEAIDRSAAPVRDDPSERRDLKLFTESLDKSMRDGTLQDPDGSIRLELDQFKRSMSTLTSSFHGEHVAGSDTMGGLTAMLPGLLTRDTSAGAEAQTLIGQALHFTGGFETQQGTQLQSTAKTAQFYLQQIDRETPSEQQPLLAGAHVAEGRLEQALKTGNDAEIKTALRDLQAELTKLRGSDVDKTSLATVVPSYRKAREQTLEYGSVPGASSWDSLLADLTHTSGS